MARGSQSLTSALSEKIKDRILTTGLQGGDPLMTEAQLGKEFGASHRVTREAVNRLRALGVVESRRRKGIVVGNADPVKLFSSSVALFGRTRANFIELARLRFTLEIGALDMAIVKASSSQLEQLKQFAEQFASLVADHADRAALYAVEYSFHRTILEATGSRLIAGMHQVLFDFFKSEEKLYSEPPVGLEAAAWEHKMIAEAFRARDLERTRAFLRWHLHPLLLEEPVAR